MASLLQPVVGMVTDKHPLPYSLPLGMCFTLGGLLLLSVAPSYTILLVAVALIGCGSSVFHPESARVARMASGGRYGFAQSMFQIGGNLGQALGPILAAAIVLRFGRSHVGWFGLMALLAIVILLQVSRWYRRHVDERVAKRLPTDTPLFSPRLVRRAIFVLLVLTDPNAGKASFRAAEKLARKARSRRRSHLRQADATQWAGFSAAPFGRVCAGPSTVLRVLERERPFLRTRALHTTRHKPAE
jgi:MFS family permease